MLDFLKRNKIKDRRALHLGLQGYHGIQLPHHDSEEFNDLLPTLLTMEMISSGFDSHFEPAATVTGDVLSIDVTSSPDTFDAGGGFSGGGGASGDF